MSPWRTASHFTRSLVVGAALAAAALASPALAESWQSIPANPDVSIVYIPPEAPNLQAAYQVLKQRQVLEELQRFTAPLHLPHHLRLQTAQCNQVNAFYNSGDRSLTLCYELVDYILSKAPQTTSPDGLVTRQAAIFGNIIGVLLHEGGHMMFDMFDVPRFGREEDAADENAAFLAQQFSPAVARTIVRGFGYFFETGSFKPTGASTITAFADEHGTDQQRLYNMLCLAYGGQPQLFQEFVDRGWLPKSRAAGCAAEYAQVKYAFADTILPFIDPVLMDRVRKAEWLTPEELK